MNGFQPAFWVFIPNIQITVSIQQQWQFSPAGCLYRDNPQAEPLENLQFRDWTARIANKKARRQRGAPLK